MRLTAALVALAAWLSAEPAVGYPENIREGYVGCQNCHVAIGGGGVLTPYGRMVGGEFMSTWGFRGEENLGSGLVELPDWLAVGGDLRAVSVRTERDARASYQAFVMQSDVELALSPVEAVTFVGSAGVYGPSHELEYRRFYLKLAAGGVVTTRVGRYVPAYGIGFADHRLPTRSGLGLGQGSESYNFEAAVSGRFGELILTRVAGKAAPLGMAGGSYEASGEGAAGFVIRAAAFLSSMVQLGVSHLTLGEGEASRQAVGVHLAAAASEQLYLLAEADRLFAGERTEELGVVRLGVVPWRGVHVVLLGEAQGESLGFGLALAWLPRPHFEFTAEAKRLGEPGSPPSDVALVMAHHYL